MNFMFNFFKDGNNVNEDSVMGVLCFIAMCVAGFIPAVPIAVFYGFMTSMLLFFGKKMVGTKSVSKIENN